MATEKESNLERTPWLVHECPSCFTLLRVRAVPVGASCTGALIERIETQFFVQEGAEHED